MVRVVVIGFGGMGRKYVELIASGKVAGMTLAGVCCRNQEGQMQIGKLYPQAKIYADVEDTFSHEEDFDGVIIVTPHRTHVEIAKMAFNYGKHVMCDKPAGVHGQEVRELLHIKEELEKETGKVLSFGMMFNNRALPAFKKAKELLEKDTLGNITRAVWVCNTWFRSPAYHASAPWRSSWRGEQGGLLINQCQHYLDIWQWLFGMPEWVDADIDFGKYNDFTVDDSVDIRFTYLKKEENLPPLRGSFISASGEHPGVNRLEIWGSKGRMTIEGGEHIELDLNQTEIPEFNKENTEVYASPEHKKEEIKLETVDSTYAVMLQNFADHINNKVPLIATGQDGLNAILLANSAYLSAWDRKKISFPMEEDRYARRLEEKRET